MPAAAAAKSLQSGPTLCDPTDGSPPGSSVPGIFQARVLEWGAISFSKPVDLNIVKGLSRKFILKRAVCMSMAARQLAGKVSISLNITSKTLERLGVIW